MMQILTPADYRVMPWANGRGHTTELLRLSYADGSLRLRLSVASVTEDGPFSILPGIKRNLTVISGPGFDLVGKTTLRADPLTPVAFDGGDAFAARGVSAPSEDFNVMVGPTELWPVVTLITDGKVAGFHGEMLYLFALNPARVGGRLLEQRHLLCGRQNDPVSGGPVIAVQIA